MALISCDECGKEVSNKAISCPGCGAPIIDVDPKHRPVVVTAHRNRSTATALALFLGGLGVHKFYLNRPGWGLLYAIFCWTFIPLVIGFIEALIYIFMSDQEFQESYSNQHKIEPEKKAEKIDNCETILKCYKCNFSVSESEFKGSELLCPECDFALNKIENSSINKRKNNGWEWGKPSW